MKLSRFKSLKLFFTCIPHFLPRNYCHVTFLFFHNGKFDGIECRIERKPLTFLYNSTFILLYKIHSFHNIEISLKVSYYQDYNLSIILFFKFN